MKKIAILLLITITSCNKPNDKINYANILENYFSNSEIELLNEACSQFESQLIAHYPNETIGITYKRFLNDIGSLNESSVLIKDTSEPILTELKNSSVFDKIWIKYSATYYEDDSHETQVLTNAENTGNETGINPKDFYITNPKGAYVECLNANENNAYVHEYTMALKDIGNISPQILAQGLSNAMEDKDYDDKTVRLLIALNLFYELELNRTK